MKPEIVYIASEGAFFLTVPIDYEGVKGQLTMQINDPTTYAFYAWVKPERMSPISQLIAELIDAGIEVERFLTIPIPGITGGSEG